MELNDITYAVRGAIFSVYNELGPGLLERVYEEALALELSTIGLTSLRQVPINVLYKGKNLGLGFTMDILVEDTVIIELKSVESIADVHKKQLLTYLKLTNKPLGLLVNFNTADINANIIRIAN